MISEIIHRFFFFLSTNQGTLFKYFIEGLLFTVLSYMIISEFRRSKETEMKFLATAFVFLSLEKIISVLYLSYFIFGNIPIIITQSKLPLIDGALEIIALIWLSNSFLYPLFNRKQKIFQKKIKFELIISGFSIILVTLIWNNILRTINIQPDFFLFKGNILFLILKIFFLLTPIMYIYINKQNLKNKNSILLAFMMYSITPIIELINYGVLSGGQFQLFGLVHPFPMISVLLFTRIIYLKLANKASLQERLRISQKKYHEAKEINKLKDEFVSVVSHEIKTPLTSIRLYLSLMEEGEFGKISTEQKKAIRTLKDESRRLTDMVTDILDISKLEANKTKLNLEVINVSDLLDENSYYKLAEKKGIKIIKEITPEVYAKIDLAKFQQIIINLLSNAIKYTPNNGKIIIKLTNTKKNWIFAVKDTGPGIPKDKIPKLFNKFYQVDDFMTRKQGGTGLGLAIVYELVKLHNGEIKVKSNLGKGSEFTTIFKKRQRINVSKANK